MEEQELMQAALAGLLVQFGLGAPGAGQGGEPGRAGLVILGDVVINGGVHLNQVADGVCREGPPKPQ